MGPTPLPNVTGGAGGAAGPSDAASHLNGKAAFDDSNWTVSTGQSSASGPLGTQTLLIAGGLALAALIVWKRAL